MTIIEFPFGITARIHKGGASVTGTECWENETQAAGYRCILATLAAALEAGAEPLVLRGPIAGMVRSLRNCGLAMIG
jgi:hypothetical protein